MCLGWRGGEAREAKPSGKKRGGSLNLRQSASYQAGKQVAPDECPMPREVYTGSLECECGTPRSVQGNSLGCEKKIKSLFTFHLVV